MIHKLVQEDIKLINNNNYNKGQVTTQQQMNKKLAMQHRNITSIISTPFLLVWLQHIIYSNASFIAKGKWKCSVIIEGAVCCVSPNCAKGKTKRFFN